MDPGMDHERTPVGAQKRGFDETLSPSKTREENPQKTVRRHNGDVDDIGDDDSQTLRTRMPPLKEQFSGNRRVPVIIVPDDDQDDIEIVDSSPELAQRPQDRSPASRDPRTVQTYDGQWTSTQPAFPFRPPLSHSISTEDEIIPSSSPIYRVMNMAGSSRQQGHAGPPNSGAVEDGKRHRQAEPPQNNMLGIPADPSGDVVYPSASLRDCHLQAAILESQQTQEQEEIIMSSQVEVERVRLNEYSDRLIAAHGEGAGALLTAAFDLTGMPCDGWVTLRKGGVNCTYNELRSRLIPMVLGFDEYILKHLVHGDILRAFVEDSEFRKVIKSTKNTITTCPAIYAQYLVDERGLSPTPRELQTILNLVELYIRGLDKQDIESSALATKVDDAFNTIRSSTWGYNTAHAGKRRYTSGGPQQNTTMEWIKSLRRRISTEPLDEPLTRSIAEVGYALRPTERLEQHAKHQSSNYLMNLTEAICKVKFGGKYFIWQCVLCHLVDPTHAIFAEILCSRLALAYTSQGGGFSHYQAGVSNNSIEKVGDAYWREMQRALTNDTGFKERMEKELQLLRDMISVVRTGDITQERVQRFRKIVDRNLAGWKEAEKVHGNQDPVACDIGTLFGFVEALDVDGIINIL